MSDAPSLSEVDRRAQDEIRSAAADHWEPILGQSTEFLKAKEALAGSPQIDQMEQDSRLRIRQVSKLLAGYMDLSESSRMRSLQLAGISALGIPSGWHSYLSSERAIVAGQVWTRAMTAMRQWAEQLHRKHPQVIPKMSLSNARAKSAYEALCADIGQLTDGDAAEMQLSKSLRLFAAMVVVNTDDVREKRVGELAGVTVQSAQQATPSADKTVNIGRPDVKKLTNRSSRNAHRRKKTVARTNESDTTSSSQEKNSGPKKALLDLATFRRIHGYKSMMGFSMSKVLGLDPDKAEEFEKAHIGTVGGAVAIERMGSFLVPAHKQEAPKEAKKDAEVHH